VAAWLAYARLGSARASVAVLVAAAVFSHWLLDALVHQPELPIAGESSRKVGFGLWQSMPIALIAEAAIVVAGLLLFMPGNNLSRGKLRALAILSIVVLAFTVVGMTIAPPPPSPQTMAMSSLATLAVVCALAYWLGKVPGEWQP